MLPLLQAYRAFYKQMPDAEREREYLAAHLRDGTSTVFLARSGERAAGFVQLFKAYSTVHLASAWILEDLFVAPEFRRAGIAAALLEQALAHARADGAAGMFLETAQDNAVAQRVYERAGWTRDGRFLKYNAPLG